MIRRSSGIGKSAAGLGVRREAKRHAALDASSSWVIRPVLRFIQSGAAAIALSPHSRACGASQVDRLVISPAAIHFTKGEL